MQYRRKKVQGGKFVLIINKKSYMSFPLVSKSVISNDLKGQNGKYFAFFKELGTFRGALPKVVEYIPEL